VNVVSITPSEITVRTLIWSSADATLKDGPVRNFTRH
jgi:hypothetical protein